MKKQWDRLTYRELKKIPFEKMLERYNACDARMNDNEKEVFELIAEVMDTLPLEFFQRSTDELNAHFGGTADMAVTENVREAMFWFKAVIGVMEAQAERLEQITGSFTEEDDD